MSGLFDRIGQELDAREKTPGLTLSEVLALPDDQRHLCNWLMRRVEVGLADVAAFLKKDEPETRAAMNCLIVQGFVRELDIKGTVKYRIRLAPKKGREVPLNIWQALDNKTAKEEGGK